MALLVALYVGRGSNGVALAAVWAMAAVLVNVGGQSVLLTVTSGIGIAAVLVVWLRMALAGHNSSGWTSPEPLRNLSQICDRADTGLRSEGW